METACLGGGMIAILSLAVLFVIWIDRKRDANSRVAG
jgi:hypothetical protein